LTFAAKNKKLIETERDNMVKIKVDATKGVTILRNA